MFKNSPNFSVKAIRQFGANFVACQLATGERRWYIFGWYLAPGDGTTIQDVEVVIVEWPRRADMILKGDFNMHPESMGGWVRDE